MQKPLENLEIYSLDFYLIMVIKNQAFPNQDEKDTKLLQKNCIDYFCKIVLQRFSLRISFSIRQSILPVDWQI